MSRRRRNAYSSYYGSRGGSRGLADWFGLLALLCMLVCSVILLVRVLGAGVLTTVLTVVLILVLVLLNGLHAFVQLPVRRNVAGKLICAVVALVLSAAMIFTSTAAGSLMKFLSNITSGGSAKTTTCVVVRADDPAETVNDTFGYTYGILETLDRENTDAALSHIEDGMGQVKTAQLRHPHPAGRRPAEPAGGRRYPQQQLLLRPQGHGGIPELLQGHQGHLPLFHRQGGPRAHCSQRQHLPGALCGVLQRHR